MAIEKRVLLNRAIFTQRPYDSGALTVLTTLFHHFPEPGDYDVLVRSAGSEPGVRSLRGEHRLKVKVVADGAPSQINIDLAAPAASAAEKSCCPGEGGEYLLQANGVIGFYAAQGTSAYSLVIKRSEGREKKVLLDSASSIPAGDLFTVTLVRPGSYKIVDVLSGRHEAVVHVVMPPVPKPEPVRRPVVTPTIGPPLVSSRARPRYRPDQPTLLTFDQNGFSSRESKVLGGQTIVFLCKAPARLRVEQIRQDDLTPNVKRLTVRRVIKREP